MIRAPSEARVRLVPLRRGDMETAREFLRRRWIDRTSEPTARFIPLDVFVPRADVVRDRLAS